MSIGSGRLLAFWRTSCHNFAPLAERPVHADQIRRRRPWKKSPKDTLVRTWIQVSIDVVSPDGTRRPLYGENPKGVVIYKSDGYFSLMQARVDLPKLKSAYPQKRRLTKPKP
jgi:hypothetical protein